MPKLVPLPAKKVIQILLKLGRKNIRIQGSHHFFQNDKGYTTVVPVHSNEDIGVGLLKKILRDTHISGDEREKYRYRK